jgi:hypothetical protein
LVRCILLELSLGHELFCDHWMVAYNYDLLQKPEAFERELLECRKSIEADLTGSLNVNPQLVDLILGMLAIDARHRQVFHSCVARGDNDPWHRQVLRHMRGRRGTGSRHRQPSSRAWPGGSF